ncbi:AGE family epimerase/isomerase [Actinomyces howellii]|uniref:Uncharacterized sugar isomerase yihS n=1 Tax=Actinomyces howellii TaxID=52771 RepID=A0A448HIR1_9ACTO|nr:AGE family epimerase/isomerase [Actinomyces howellii]VEG29436.1 Uncharacterized sugar isomerase yihS [Actinomyces howellii]
MTAPATRAAFDAEARALLAFATASRTDHGFGWLDDTGAVDPERGVHLWITGRMTHCFALGQMLGHPDSPELAAHGVEALLNGPLRDRATGAWASAVDLDGSPRRTPLVSYDHSFVVLAASSAALAGVPGATDLLEAGLETLERLWWDEEAGMVVDARDPVTLAVDPYRGANATMHTVEALLAAYSATREPRHLERASRATTRIAGQFTAHGLRLPEHFDESWTPLLDYNRDIPADAFRPYGSTIGHWLEWSRLMIQVRTACDAAGVERSGLLDTIPAAMYRQALREGWGPDGEPGFVYTVDFEGRPVVHERMYWVLCEAIGAAETLSRDTGDASYDLDVEAYWAWARTYLIERPGQWREELDASNRPGHGTWSGKPDVYHAIQAMLVGGLPVTPSFAEGLRGEHRP